MFHLEYYQSKIKYILLILAFILIAAIVIVAYKTNKEIKKNNDLTTLPALTKRTETESGIQKQLNQLDKLRSQEIQEKSPEEQIKELDALKSQNKLSNNQDLNDLNKLKSD